MIGYASFAPMNPKHNKEEEGMYANLKRQVFNLTHELHDTESTTYIAPTADNHLDPNYNTAAINEEKELQQQLQREHFQHKRHLKLQQLKEQLEEEQQKNKQTSQERDEQQHGVQHKHNKHHRHHQHRHHQHLRHHIRNNNNNNDDEKVSDDVSAILPTRESNIEQQQNDAKLLQHIAYKLQHEQRQLHLLNQQRASTFNI